MKNISLILNAVLLLAVGVLYYLHFSSDKSSQVSEPVAEDTTTVTAPVELPEIKASSGTIAYINNDSLVENYTFYKNGIKELERNYRSKLKQLSDKEQKLQENYQRYQQLAHTYSEETRAIKEEEILNGQKELLADRDKYQEDYARMEEDFSKKYLKRIDDYMKNLAKEKNYSYVFIYSKGGPASIVYAKDSLEITKQVIEGLNRQEKTKK